MFYDEEKSSIETLKVPHLVLGICIKHIAKIINFAKNISQLVRIHVIWKASGLSKEIFCKQREVATGTFYGRCQKLRPSKR
ncbi:MAG: hypothetical protein A3F18_07340 [Legionellales bacterium RIFCSPHIGHO2_12_FULL_37_14]|nr:MAG: hypothetical protein A3F18_07340 [Legionellales bacterium RIFCSPHIGHO2_12_FULL_37_14]